MRRHTHLWLVSCLALMSAGASSQSVRSGNPILPGWYADPEAHVFGNEYWIYPDVLGPVRPAGVHGRLLVQDLVTWTKHARVLDIAERAVGPARVVGAVDRGEGWLVLPVLRRQRHPERPAAGRHRRRPRAHAGGTVRGPPRQAADRSLPQRCPADRPVRLQRSRRLVLHRLRRLAALQHREAERRLHRLRAVSRRDDVQGDHAARATSKARSCC